MKADGLTREEMIEGLVQEFDIPEDIAEMFLNKEEEPAKKDFLKVFKDRPQSEQKSYTAPGYEVNPGESEAVHIEVEQRNFEQRTGRRLSTPRILKIDVVDWKHWLSRRGGQGYEINKVFHRPSGIEPIQVDDWEVKYNDQGGVESSINKGEVY